MPNIGIYLPQDVFDRLEARRQSGHALRLSEVCKRAVEAELDAVIGSAAEDRRLAIAERLKASMTPREHALDRGRNTGRRWAEDVATWADLKMVAYWQGISVEPSLFQAALASGRPVETALMIDGQLFPALTGLPRSSDFLDSRTTLPEFVEAFWKGFSQGARQVHDLVRGDLEGSR